MDLDFSRILRGGVLWLALSTSETGIHRLGPARPASGLPAPAPAPARPCPARSGVARRGPASLGVAQLGSAWRGIASLRPASRRVARRYPAGSLIASMHQRVQAVLASKGAMTRY